MAEASNIILALFLGGEWGHIQCIIFQRDSFFLFVVKAPKLADILQSKGAKIYISD